MQRRIAHMLVRFALCSFVIGIFLSVFIIASKQARDTQGVSNLRRLSEAAMLYAEEHDGYLPPLENGNVARAALAPFLHRDSDEAWKIPGIIEGYYLPNVSLSKKRLSSIKNADEIILFYELGEPLERKYRGRRVAFADGHAKWLRESKWSELAVKSGVLSYSERRVY